MLRHLRTVIHWVVRISGAHASQADHYLHCRTYSCHVPHNRSHSPVLKTALYQVVKYAPNQAVRHSKLTPRQAFGVHNVFTEVFCMPRAFPTPDVCCTHRAPSPSPVLMSSSIQRCFNTCYCIHLHPHRCLKHQNRRLVPPQALLHTHTIVTTCSGVVTVTASAKSREASALHHRRSSATMAVAFFTPTIVHTPALRAIVHNLA